MKIVQISSCCSDKYFYVTGIGDDGLVYLWKPQTQTWELYKQEND